MERHAPVVSLAAASNDLSPPTTIASIPSSTHAIRYAALAAPDGECAEHERLFRRRAIYVASQQSVIARRERLILDVRFGSLLRDIGGSWQIVPGAFYRPYAPGEAAYLAEVNDILPRRLRRNLVDDLTTSDGLDDTWRFPVFGRWSRVYFHLLSESLGQIQAISDAGYRSKACAITVGSRNSVQDIAQSHLESLGISFTEAESRFCWIDRSITYTGLYQHAPINTVFQTMVRTVRARAGLAPAANPDRLIYVSRLGAKARPLDNEAELAARAERLGYEVVDPGHLTFLDQVRLFSAARVVAGPHGAGLANAAFCAPGSILLEFRPLNRSGQSPMLNESYRRICAVQNLRYEFAMFANAPGTDAWSVDVERAARLLDLAAHADRDAPSSSATGP